MQHCAMFYLMSSLRHCFNSFSIISAFCTSKYGVVLLFRWHVECGQRCWCSCGGQYL